MSLSVVVLVVEAVSNPHNPHDWLVRLFTVGNFVKLNLNLRNKGVEPKVQCSEGLQTVGQLVERKRRRVWKLILTAAVRH